MTQLIIYLAILLAGFGAGWETNGWRMGTEVQTLKTEHAQTVADAQAAANKHEIQLVNQRDALAEQVSQIDQAGTAQLQKAQDENQTLRTRIASGAVRLRIAASCPTGTQSGTGSTQSPGVDTGTGATLDASAGQAYSDLRSGITVTETRLTACQEVLAKFSP